MAKLQAFILGMIEFRSDFTTHYDDLDVLEAYDRGRDFAHAITFRHWD
jgi:hypothetical protein